MFSKTQLKINVRALITSVCLLILSCSLFSACHTSRQTQKMPNFRQLAKASKKLGLYIDYGDNYNLYIEASKWLGVPYKLGGNNKSGIDCSGLTKDICKKVYNVDLARRSVEQLNKNCKQYHTKGQLKEGDLVFFSSPTSKGICTHVGIYLKEQKFIHASSSKGVMVSPLSNPYWKKYWIVGGNIK